MILNYKNSRIHYTVAGKGQSILLLHGFLETIEMWAPFKQQLSKTNQVVCIDLLGHGNSECLSYIHTMETMADVVFSILKAEGIGKVKCIGHSMGGYVALALAEKHPDLFDGLCLMNSTFEADDEERKTVRARAIEMAKTNFNSVVRVSFSNLFAPESRLKFKPEFDIALRMALQTSVQGYIAAQEGMRIRPDRFDIFQNLNAKKALIISKKDWVVNVEYLKAKTKNTDIEIIEFSEGHMSHIENKEELSYFLKRFIEK